MELQDLRSGWHNAGDAYKSETDLLTMTKINPSLKKIRRKLIVETISLTLFLLVYYDWFDGDKKPFYANALLVSSVLLYIINGAVGYVSLLNPISGLNLKTSIEGYLARIKQLSVFSVALSFLYSICFLVFFISVINFNREKSFILLGIILVLFQVMFWSYRIWNKWIKNLEQQMKDLDHEEES
jgi:hypothetical protein